MNPIANLITAAFAASIVATLFSMVWYSPGVFGKKWMKLAKVEKKKKDPEMGSKMLTSFFATFTMAMYLVMILAKFEASNFIDGAQIGFLIGIGIAAPALLSSSLWEERPRDLYLINAAHYVLSLMLMALTMVFIDNKLSEGLFSAF